jgi:hypothetical protein
MATKTAPKTSVVPRPGCKNTNSAGTDKMQREGLEEDYVFADGLLGDVPGQHDHQARLSELRGLYLNRSDVHPPLSASRGPITSTARSITRTKP